MAETTDKKKDLRGSVTFRGTKTSTVGHMVINGKITKITDNDVLAKKDFNLNSYKWSEDYQINGNAPLVDFNTVPKLIMTEIQPKKKVDWSKILSDMTAFGEIPGIKQVIEGTTSGIGTLSQVQGSNYLNGLTDKYSSSVSSSSELLDITDIENLIDGDVVNTYQIPFYNNMYLKSETKDGWSVGNALESAGRFGELMNDGFQMNILKSPQWSNNNTEAPGWDTEFFLLNDDLEALQKNFTFINAIFPSTQWVHMKGDGAKTEMIEDGINAVGKFVNKIAPESSIGNLSLAYSKSPNLFRVECPGRFLQLFVSLDITVEFVGNVRKMPLYTKIKGIAQVNENTLYPDAYKITISARDLTPSCFNVQASYLMGGQKVNVTTKEYMQYGRDKGGVFIPNRN